MKVKTSSTGCEYITAGKEYDVIEYDQTGFSIIDDQDERIVCVFKKDLHLWGDDWEIIEERP